MNAATHTLSIPNLLYQQSKHTHTTLSLSHSLNEQSNYAYIHYCSECIHMSECLCVTVCVYGLLTADRSIGSALGTPT